MGPEGYFYLERGVHPRRRILAGGPDPRNPGFQQMVEIDVMRCIGCQNCSQDCPWETISMYNHDDAFVAWGNETLKSDLYIPEEQLQKKLDDLGYKDPNAEESTEEDKTQEA